VLIAEVPGVKKDEIEVRVKGRTVRIAGGKSVDYPKGSAVHRRERLAGRFDRAVSLPIEIDPDHVQAECHDGVLALLLTRAEHDRPKTIKVN
jgi:HSP20 family protein